MISTEDFKPFAMDFKEVFGVEIYFLGMYEEADSYLFFVRMPSHEHGATLDGVVSVGSDELDFRNKTIFQFRLIEKVVARMEEGLNEVGVVRFDELPEKLQSNLRDYLSRIDNRRKK